MIGNILHKSKSFLRDANVSSYSLDAELLLADILGVSRETVIAYPERKLTEKEIKEFDSFIGRRVKREPISYILGRREFWGREFKVTSDTLDPRPDSETIIEAILDMVPDRDKPLRVLDIGVGTGCLLLTILAEFPNANGVGVDISRDAVRVAEFNSQKLGLANRAKFVVDSWAKGVDGVFDLVISNPPYIKNSDIKSLEPEVAKYEPHIALSGGKDGLDCYRILAPGLLRLLSEEGFAVLEFGIGQEKEVKNILSASGLEFISFRKDLAGITRCIIIKR